MLSLVIRSKILTSTSLRESDNKKVVNQHSDTNMLIVEMIYHFNSNKQLDVNSFFFYFYTIKSNSISNHQDAFYENKQIRLFLCKNYKKRIETRIFMNKKNVMFHTKQFFGFSSNFFPDIKFSRFDLRKLSYV